MSSKLVAALDGIFCVYKPHDMSISGLRKYIIRKICEDGNDVIGQRELPTVSLPVVEPHPTSGALVVVGSRIQKDYMLHPSVSGELFRSEDIRLEDLNYMESSTSGVCVVGINNGCDDLPRLQARSWVNSYRIEGMLGRETLKHEIKGRVTLKADYGHVTKHRMSKLLSRVQAQYRRSAFEVAEVDLQSEAAFELARKGLPRAQLPGAQLMYSIELDSFNPPYFALHVQSAGESDEYLRNFLHEIGVSLGTTASCVKLQRRSVGPLTADHALLEKQISLQNILRNISMCRKIIASAADSEDSRVVSELSDDRIKELPKDLVDGLGMSQSAMEYDAMRPAWPRNYT